MKKIFLIALTFCVSVNLWSQEKEYKHSVDFTPLSPIMGIYALHYNYKVTPKNELVFSPSYMRIKYENIGHTDAWGIIVGYRRYLWKNLHIEYQIWPMLDSFYDQDTDKKMPLSFDLWSEFRFGYKFDFKIGKAPLFVNVQWPLGFGLYYNPDGKPEAWKAKNKKEPLFYFPPLFFVGIYF